MGDALYEKYHDEEWGKPIHDDRLLFEFFVLESFQAGLSWLTILKRRENLREAFDNFDYKKIAEYSNEKVEQLVVNEGIIRHRGKILAIIKNAQLFMEIQQEVGSFDKYLWSFTEGKIIDNRPETISDIPAKTALSEAVYKDLKKKGFKFLGSTTIYAYLQAVGVINDHINQCFAK